MNRKDVNEKNLEKEMNSAEVYSIPNEDTCSAEFAEGCVIAEEKAE